MVHSTGANNPNLKRYVDAPDEVGVNKYSNHWNVAKPGGNKVCVHAFIGYDINKKIRVAEILPLDICCWGVGKGKNGSYNYDPSYIQFEICEDSLADKQYYTEAFKVAAQYCAHLCMTYGLSVEKIVGHCEAYCLGYGSNHSDPEHWMERFGETMDDFRNKVRFLLAVGSEQVNITTSIAGESYDIHEGDLVSIASGATYYNGAAIPAWVKNQNWYVNSEPTSDRIVIDKNEFGTNSICSPIHKKYLNIVKSATAYVSSEPDNTANKKCPYTVRVTVNALNIRKGAGTNTAKTGVITDKGVYTIVEEADGIGATKWGRLKSGAGWISLDYVKRA